MWRIWAGAVYKDRELLALAAAQHFDVFITADKNLPYQQKLPNPALRVVVLNTMSTRPVYLLPLIVQMSDQLQSLAAGSVTMINDAGEITSFKDK